MTGALTVLLLVPLAAAGAGTLSYETFAGVYARLMNGETAVQVQDTVPGLARNLKTAARVSSEHWTDCTVVDELAHGEILPARALDALGIPRRTDGGVTHVPAGVMHTYGYLFSQLATPFGLKGKRWIESRLDERLGLPAGTFSPFSARGEFASNVTTALLDLAGPTPPARPLGRVEQRVTWRTRDQREVSAVVVTRLVRLKPLRELKTSETALLVYEVVRDGRRRFVTAFPVDQAFADRLAATRPSREPAFKPRFNLYVDPAWTVVAQESAGFISARGARRW